MSQAGEKTEQPTAKRLRDARRKGQVTRSHDLSSAVLLIVSVAVLYLAGGHVAGWAGGAMREQLEHAATNRGPLGQAAALGALFTGVKALAFVLAPLFAALLVVAFLANYFQVGSVFSFEPVKPSANKLNPAEGFKQKFLKARPYVELGKTALKLVIASVVVGAELMAAQGQGNASAEAVRPANQPGVQPEGLATPVGQPGPQGQPIGLPAPADEAQRARACGAWERRAHARPARRASRHAGLRRQPDGHLLTGLRINHRDTH